MHMAVETQNINVGFPTRNDSEIHPMKVHLAHECFKSRHEFHSMTHELTRSPVSLASDHVYRQQAWELQMSLSGMAQTECEYKYTRADTHTHSHTQMHTHTYTGSG